jgi:N-methylhydantoinase A/oxoprolinase/acetone carboxylase beta subunit
MEGDTVKIGLGIDTGGTFTDAVLFDRESGRLLAKCKVPTNHYDLVWSIRESIASLGPEISRADYVSLSTTLATNAMVEGQGVPVGLIAAGGDLNWPLPPCDVRQVAGGHGVDGSELTPLDEKAVADAARHFSGRVEAIAISTFFSVHNPEHELSAKAIVGQITGVPVVCGHELTSQVGFRERTNTVVLNARLIPIIEHLIQAAKDTLAELGLKVPLMIVKSDGSLVEASQAMLRPVQTVLSGPAASIMGAVYLTGLKEGVIVDIGGTTSDIGIVQNGAPRLQEEGATIGRWRTRVRSADITTLGLGGDSYIKWDRDRLFLIGPRRVQPLVSLAATRPGITGQLRQVVANPDFKPFRSEPADIFYLLREGGIDDKRCAAVVQALRQGPLSAMVLAETTGCHPDLLPLQILEETGVVGRAGLTPTDILHSVGLLSLWDDTPAKLGVTIMARRLGLTEQELEQGALERIRKMLATELLEKAIVQDLDLKDPEFCRICRSLIGEAIGPARMNLLRVNMDLKLPLVGVGAPAGLLLSPVAAALGTRLVVPENAEVANAVGAAVGNVVETAEIILRADETGGLLLFSPWERRHFDGLDEAREYVMKNVRKNLEDAARRNGTTEVEIGVREELIEHLGINYYMTATGSPWPVENERGRQARGESQL